MFAPFIMGRSKPLPHGLRASFVFSRNDCKTMKISQAMAGPAVKYWSSIDGISEALVKAHGDEDLSAKDARNLFTKALRTIRAKNPNQPSLALYCHEVCTYLTKDSNKKAFALVTRRSSRSIRSSRKLRT